MVLGEGPRDIALNCSLAAVGLVKAFAEIGFTSSIKTLGHYRYEQFKQRRAAPQTEKKSVPESHVIQTEVNTLGALALQAELLTETEPNSGFNQCSAPAELSTIFTSDQEEQLLAA